MTITEPGIYDLDEAIYHADPVPETSLSQSGAKALLDCPARFQWEREHKVFKAEYDFGHVAHRLVLGSGATPWVVDAPDWRTRAAQEARRQAREDGLAPILRSDYRKAVAMAAQVRRHPIASRLFTGDSEVSMFARDPETKVMLRARADHIAKLPDGRPVIVDYKTVARTANPDRFGWAAWDYGYDIQDPWYRLVASEVGIEDPAFVFVIQEKDPPHLVSVIELDDWSRDIGTERGRAARHIYRDCMTADHWPDYPAIIHRASLPRTATAPIVEGDHDDH